MRAVGAGVITIRRPIVALAVRICKSLALRIRNLSGLDFHALLTPKLIARLNKPRTLTSKYKNLFNELDFKLIFRLIEKNFNSLKVTAALKAALFVLDETNKHEIQKST